MSASTPPNTKCPHCGGLLSIQPTQWNAPVACPQCGNPFIPQPLAIAAAPMAMPLPPHLRMPSGPAPMAAPMGIPMATPSPGMMPGMPMGGPLPPHLLPKLDAAAAVGSSIATTESASITRAKAQKSHGLMLYAILGGLLLAGLGMVGVIVLIVSNREELEVAEEVTPPEVRIVHVEHESKRFPATSPVNRDKVRIRIESIAIGPVEFLNAQRQPRFTDDKNYLTVNFLIRNESKTPRKYLSWFDNVFHVAEKQVRPQLLNAEETEEYACLEPIEGAKRIGYHSESQYDLPDGIDIRDSVVFQITPELAANPQPLHLNLPGGALNSATPLKFLIPPSMIQVQ